MKRGSVVFFTVLNGCNQITGRFPGHAFQAGQRIDIQSVQIGRCMNQLAIDQLINQFFSQPVDIDGAAGSKMQNCLLALRRTI